LTLTVDDARRLQECLGGGGLAVFPADTVYGIGCDPEDRAAFERLYALKGRPAARPAAVMFFSLDAALAALPELGERERGAMQALLPGPVTLLLPNRRHRFPLACGPDPDTLGVRVPLLVGNLAALSGVSVPVVQSSANISGEADVRRLADVPAALREGVDLALDGGELPGIASTVIDLRAYEGRGEWGIVRAGPVASGELERVLGGLGGGGDNC
jgi:L-threonylcarbamoyladenylate synthase